ncbi:unnamed protein product [Closterium sp. NIES-54]
MASLLQPYKIKRHSDCGRFHLVMAASQESVCRRCRTLFRREENSQEACRFHPKMFVSRKHDDQKRYYELKDGDPEYLARFYDCCGAEDPSAPGCTTACHVSYDD